MVIENVLFTILGFAIGVLAPLGRDIIHDLKIPPHDWRAIMKGVWRSRVGVIPVLLAIILVLIGAYLYDKEQNRLTTIAESQRQMQIINAINDVKLENNQKFQDLIDRIDKLIATLEAQNVSGNTPTK